MSILAQKWAWEQNIPNVTAKFLLVTMADQTDARDGLVRYQETSAAFFSAKCTISVRTFWRAIATLEAHGYLHRNGHRGGGRGKSTEFRLCLERPASAIAEWGEDEGDNTVSLSQYSDEKLCEIMQGTVTDLPPKTAPADTVSRKDIIENQSTKESTSARSRSRRASARAPARSGNPAKGDPPDFVCAGTRQWRALRALYEAEGREWIERVGRGHGDHANHTGRYFRRSEKLRALSAWRAAHGPDPPVDDPDDDGQAESNTRGNDHDDGNGWQSAASL